MGCASSVAKKVKAGDFEKGAIQDEARSYRSKVGAMRLVLKNEMTREVFKKFIENEGNQDGRTEFVTYFEILDELKPMPQSEQVVRLKKLMSLTPAQPDATFVPNDGKMIHSTLWSCLRPLRPLKLDTATQIELMKAIGNTQDLLLSPVTPEFERFMESAEFVECKKESLNTQQKNKSSSKAISPRQANINKKLAAKKESTIAATAQQKDGQEFVAVGLTN